MLRKVRFFDGFHSLFAIFSHIYHAVNGRVGHLEVFITSKLLNTDIIKNAELGLFENNIKSHQIECFVIHEQNPILLLHIFLTHQIVDRVTFIGWVPKLIGDIDILDYLFASLGYFLDHLNVVFQGIYWTRVFLIRFDIFLRLFDFRIRLIFIFLSMRVLEPLFFSMGIVFGFFVTT